MTKRPYASVSLDMDNLWSYMKTHGNPDWEKRPSYLSALAPRLIELWGEHDLILTVFVVGFDAARDDGAYAVSQLAGAGHEIANHSYEHEPWLHLYSPAQLEDELAQTEEAIITAGARRPIGFRGPGYSLSAPLLTMLAERGYHYDATTLPTWIGPLARAYYFRSAHLTPEQREQRSALFGAAREGLRPVHPYRWASPSDSQQQLIELPVTTMPVTRVPIHVSYLLHLYQVSPSLARRYFTTALAFCRLRKLQPSILLHPLDLLDADDAAELAFFPGMQLPARDKVSVTSWALGQLRKHFTVVGTGEHARLLSENQSLTVRNPNRVRPRLASASEQ